MAAGPGRHAESPRSEFMPLVEEHAQVGTIPCRGVLPDLQDEPVTTLRLFGRNLATVAEIDGWSHAYGDYFPDLPNRKMMPQFDLDVLKNLSEELGDQMDETPIEERPRNTRIKVVSSEEKVLEAYSNRKTLQYVLTGRQLDYAQPLCFPVFVTVIAKIKLDLVIRDQMGLIYGKLVVADETGACVIKFINNANQLAYSMANVGDTLLIMNYTLMPLKDFDRVPHFGEKLVFNGMIKIGEFDKLCLIKKEDTVNCITNFLKPSYKKLWSPSSVPNLLASHQIELVDIIGVLSHVSRFERRRRHECKVKRNDDDNIGENMVQYDITCWIEVVDKSCVEPLPILLYLSSLIWPNRHELVPGSLIVITNVKRVFIDNYYIFEENLNQTLHTSSMSQIYTNLDVRKYWAFMKCDSVDAVLQEFLGNENSSAILKRTDIPWSVGGGYPVPIEEQNKLKFLKLYNVESKKIALFRSLFVSLPIPLTRRESKLLVFQGVIVRYDRFEAKRDCGYEPWMWVKEGIRTKGIPRREIFDVFDPIPANTRSPFHWFLWKRKLPEFNLKPVRNVDSFPYKIKQYTRAERDFKELLEAVSMPAGIGKKLRKRPVIDGNPHFAVDILNKEETHPLRKRFIWTWKPSRKCTIENIENKLEELRDCEKVLVIAKMYRVESIGLLYENMGYDLMIHDILPYSPAMPSTSSK